MIKSDNTQGNPYHSEENGKFVSPSGYTDKDNNIRLTEDPQSGIQWDIPQCLYCKYNKIRHCKYLDLDRTKVDVDIFDCPYFVSNEKKKKKKRKNFLV